MERPSVVGRRSAAQRDRSEPGRHEFAGFALDLALGRGRGQEPGSQMVEMVAPERSGPAAHVVEDGGCVTARARGQELPKGLPDRRRELRVRVRDRTKAGEDEFAAFETTRVR